jgi:hypothetical protein
MDEIAQASWEDLCKYSTDSLLMHIMKKFLPSVLDCNRAKGQEIRPCMRCLPCLSPGWVQLRHLFWSRAWVLCGASSVGGSLSTGGVGVLWKFQTGWERYPDLLAVVWLKSNLFSILKRLLQFTSHSLACQSFCHASQSCLCNPVLLGSTFSATASTS